MKEITEITPRNGNIWAKVGKNLRHLFELVQNGRFVRTSSKWRIIYTFLQVFGRIKTTEVSVTTAHSKLTHKGILDKKITQHKISISI